MAGVGLFRVLSLAPEACDRSLDFLGDSSVFHFCARTVAVRELNALHLDRAIAMNDESVYFIPVRTAIKLLK